MSSRPVRVLHIITRLNISGPSMHAVLLAEKLGGAAYEGKLVSGMTESDEGDMAYFAEAHGVQTIFIPELRRAINPVRDLQALWKLYRLIREFQPDVVHTHTSKAGFLGRMAAWLGGTSVIIHTYHGHVFEQTFSWPVSRLFIALERLVARPSDTLIALTDGLRRELRDEYHIARKGRFTVLPLGLDLSSYIGTPRKSGAFRAAWDIPEGVPLVGIVGRLAPVKNHALFLEAAARIKAQLPAARFAIIGDGETRAEVETQVDALGLRESVIFTGWQRDLAPIYSDLDALVISSLTEGTPGSIIEAMAAGCPVVATEVGGVADMLDHGQLGRLVPPGDANALADAITDTLLNPPDSEAARKVMLDRYGIDQLITDLDGLYRGLLAKQRR